MRTCDGQFCCNVSSAPPRLPTPVRSCMMIIISPRQLAPRERLGLARSFAREIDATVGSAVASKPQLALEGLAWFQGDA